MMKGDTARVSSDDRIPFKEISKRLKETMSKNVDVVGRKIIVPNYYAIYFNEEDRKSRLEVEDVMTDELREELYHEMRRVNPESSKKEIVIEMKTDSSLPKGQFKIEHHIKKPEVKKETEEHGKVAATLTRTPVVEEDEDLKATIIEQVAEEPPDDYQATIIQRPVSAVLYKLLVDSGESKEEIEITKEKISMGRNSKDDVTLESSDLTISRSHATLEVRNGEYFLLPSGVNGTILNGQELELQKEVKVSSNDEIKIMNYTLSIVD